MSEKYNGKYFKSNYIDVYPSGFRGQGFGKSKLVTEDNLTSLLSFKNEEDGLYTDKRDSSKKILKLGGYSFRFSEVTSESEDNKGGYKGFLNLLESSLPENKKYIYKVYAGIRFREIPANNGSSNNVGPVGRVLHNLESSSEHSVFDLDVDTQNNASNPNYVFEGLTFILSEENKPDYTNIDYCEEIGSYIAVGDVDDRLEHKNYTFVEGKVFDDYKTENSNELSYSKITSETVSVRAHKHYEVDGSVNQSNFSEKISSGLYIYDSVSNIYTKLTDTASYDASETYYILESDTITGLDLPNKVIFYDSGYKTFLVTEIANNAFENQTLLTSINKFPICLTCIGEESFRGCIELNDITWGNSIVSEIKSFAFEGCIKIGDLPLPNGVEAIGDSAFYNCTKIGSTANTKLELPETVNSIGTNAFGADEQTDVVKNVTINNYEDRINGKPWGTLYKNIHYKDLLIDGGTIDLLD